MKVLTAACGGSVTSNRRNVGGRQQLKELVPVTECLRRCRTSRGVDRDPCRGSCEGVLQSPPRHDDVCSPPPTSLQWRPSRLARAFVAQSHGAVGIVFPDLGGPYYSGVIAGFEEMASERRVAVLILATHGRVECRRACLGPRRSCRRTGGDGSERSPTMSLRRSPVPACPSCSSPDHPSVALLPSSFAGNTRSRRRPHATPHCGTDVGTSSSSVIRLVHPTSASAGEACAGSSVAPAWTPSMPWCPATGSTSSTDTRQESNCSHRGTTSTP